MKRVRLLIASALTLTSIYSMGWSNYNAEAVELECAVIDGGITVENEDMVNSENKVEGQIELPQVPGCVWRIDENTIMDSEDTAVAYSIDSNTKWAIEGIQSGSAEFRFYAENEDGTIEDSRLYRIDVDENLQIKILDQIVSPLEGKIELDINGRDFWKYEFTDDSIAEVCVQYFGVNSEKFIIHGLNPGTTKVRMTRYVFGDGIEENMESKVFVITVDEKLNVKVKEAENI